MKLKFQEKIAGRFDASDIFDHLTRRVQSFQDRITADHEVAVQLANFGIAATLHIRSISCVNPNLIEFHGVLPEGQPATLVQHISQLNFLLAEVPPVKDEEPYRIGFGR